MERALRFYALRFNDAQALDDSEYAPTPEQAALIQRFTCARIKQHASLARRARHQNHRRRTRCRL